LSRFLPFGIRNFLRRNAHLFRGENLCLLNLRRLLGGDPGLLGGCCLGCGLGLFRLLCTLQSKTRLFLLGKSGLFCGRDSGFLSD
jgi:hypothetical protein